MFIKKILNKITPYPLEVKKVFGWLVALRDTFDSRGYSEVYNILHAAVVSEPELVAKYVVEYGSAQSFVLDRIAGISLDLLASGEHHISRGVLNPLGIGNDLVFICTQSVNELLKLQSIDKELAVKLLHELRDCVESSG